MQQLTAIIRQNWYESIKNNLSDLERLKFYEICLDFEFYDILPDALLLEMPKVKFAFDFVKSEIESDKMKARAIIKRNTENGKKGGRPKKTELSNLTDEQNSKNAEEKNPKNPVGYDNYISLHNNNTNFNEEKNLIDLIMKEREKNQKEVTKYLRWRIIIMFFEKNAQNPIYEYEKFYNYYNEKGWKTKNGANIKDIYKAAEHWGIENNNNNNNNELNKRKYIDIIKGTALCEDALITDFNSLKVVETNDRATYIFNFYNYKRCMNYLEEHIEDVVKYINNYLSIGKKISISYNIINKQPELL